MAKDYDKATSKPHFLETYQKKRKELEKLMKNWEELQSELETFS